MMSAFHYKVVEKGDIIVSFVVIQEIVIIMQKCPLEQEETRNRREEIRHSGKTVFDRCTITG